MGTPCLWTLGIPYKYGREEKILVYCVYWIQRNIFLHYMALNVRVRLGRGLIVRGWWVSVTCKWRLHLLSFRAFRHVFWSSFVFVNNNCDLLKQITWFILPNHSCCLKKQMMIELCIEMLYYSSSITSHWSCSCMDFF